MAETNSSDESYSALEVQSCDRKKTNYFYNGTETDDNSVSFSKRNDVKFINESDPEEDFDDHSDDNNEICNDKCAKRNSWRKKVKRLNKIKSPVENSSKRDNQLSLVRGSYARKTSKVLHSRLYHGERENEVLHPKKRMKYSTNTDSAERNDSFPSFLQAISVDSGSESEPTSTKSEEKALSIWGKKYDFQDKDLTLPESTISDDSDTAIQILPIKKEERKPAYDVKSFRYPHQNIEVLVMNHPAEAVLLKNITVRVIAGSVSIQGYEMNRDVLPVTVLSTKRTGFFVLTTECSEEIWKKKDLYKRIRKNLKEIVPEDLVHKILKHCGSSTVIVALKRTLYSPSLQFAQLYCTFLTFNEKLRTLSFQRHEQNPRETIIFNPEFEQLAETIKSAIQKSKLKNQPGQRILVFGHAQTGKSTLLRYLINKTLSMFIDVYYLDTDPGQTEFTPPGVVSLTKVKSPLIGPTFSHQKRPLKMIFTGSINVSSSPPMYMKSVRTLAEFYNSTCASGTLFVNTMGWVKGIGFECLQSVIKAVEPTIIIEIISSIKSRIQFDQILNIRKAKYIKINSNAPCNSGVVRSPELRNLSILSYIGRCQKPHLETAYLNDFKPFCVSWDAMPIYIFGKRLVPYRIVEAINASFVALCHVDDSLILESDVPGFQKTLQEEPDNECLGFGVVRAIDEENHLLYIVTPLSLDELRGVNAIMKGNIQLPKQLFIEQPILNTPLPFTDASKDSLLQPIPPRGRKAQRAV